MCTKRTFFSYPLVVLSSPPRTERRCLVLGDRERMARQARGGHIGRMGAVSTLSFCIASTAVGFLLAHHHPRVQASAAAAATGSDVQGNGGDVLATACSAGEGGEVWCCVAIWRYSTHAYIGYWYCSWLAHRSTCVGRGSNHTRFFRSACNYYIV